MFVSGAQWRGKWQTNFKAWQSPPLPLPVVPNPPSLQEPPYSGSPVALTEGQHLQGCMSA